MTEFNHYVGGRLETSERRFAVRNPATGDVVGHAPAANAATLNAAVAAAREAFPAWSAMPDAERGAAVMRVADAIEDNAEEMARLLTAEQGKPLNGLGSRFELQGAVAWTRHTAALTLPPEIIQDNAAGRIELHRRPIGVVGSITPWNWPLMIAAWHFAPAIRTGNTVVVKPSPLTPLSTLRMIEIAGSALPPGVLNVVSGDDTLGPLMTAHPGIAKIAFTGSSATGRKVMASASATLKRLTLELGGNDAGIVLPDADPKAIAEGIFWGAFINSGQTCAALKRLYVHDDIYDAVCDALTDYARTVSLGDGADETSQLGPLQNEAQFAKVRRFVDEARDAGARILIGGTPIEGPGYFYPVTLVADAREGMALVDEEQFGTALPIIRYRDVEDAIARANASENGLGGSVWSSDREKAKAVVARLQCGTAWINKHGAIQPDVPFGGVKASGIGTSFGRQGLEEFTTIQVVNG